MSKANNHRVHIAFILPSLEMGGSERVTLTILKSLPTDLFEVHLIVIGSEAGLLVSEVPPAVRVTFLSGKHVKSTIFRLLRLIWKLKPDVIFAGMSYVGLCLSILKSLLPSRSVLITRETSVVSLNNLSYRWHNWWNFIYRRFYRRNDFIICQTEEMRRDLLHNFHIDEKKTTVIGNPIDIPRIRKLSAKKDNVPDILHRAPATLRFVFVGRLSKEKNLDLMLDAFRSLQLHNAELLIVGSGPEEKRLKSRCMSNVIEDSVKFLGFLENPYPVMSSADALLLTSKHEGLPNAVLEAICLNIPVISTSAGGQLSAVLSKVPGCFLSEAETVDSFANAIRAWMDGHVSLENDYVTTNFDKEKNFKTLFRFVFATGLKKMKIMFIINSLNTGGAERALLRFLKSKIFCKDETVVVSLLPEGDLSKEYSQIRWIGHPSELSKISGTFMSFFSVLGVIRKHRPDVIHSWLYQSDLIAGLSAKMLGCSVIIWSIRQSNLSSEHNKLLTRVIIKFCAVLSNIIPMRL